MLIKDEKTIEEIQNEFNDKFPYLKLEFYKEKHGLQEGSPNTSKWDNQLRIGDIRTVHHAGDLSIDGHLKVATLERNFWENYGLNVQVFHKSGTVWLQTTRTDEKTLAKHNERGKASA